MSWIDLQCKKLSIATQIRKVLCQIGVGHFGEVLLQVGGDLAPSGFIERLTKVTEHMRRRNEDQRVEFVALAGFAQQCGNLVAKFCFSARCKS